jgi:WD40 repeat protein
LLIAGGAPGEVGTVDVYRWPERESIYRVARHEDLVYRVAWSPDGQTWASAGADGICQVFSRASGAAVCRFAGHSRSVSAICYLPDGKAIASAGVDQTIQLWDSRSGLALRALDNHLAPVNDLALRPLLTAAHQEAGAARAALPMLASASDDKTVRLWQPTIGRLVRFARLPAVPQSVLWSPSGDRLLVGCNDGVLRVLDPETAEVTQELGGPPQHIYTLVGQPGGAPRALVAGDAQPRSISW